MYKAPQSPQIAELTWSGSATTTPFTYSVSIDQQTTSFLTVTSGTDIDLPSGHYYAIAYPDYTRSASSDTNQIYWHLDGSQIGKVGGSDFNGGLNTDNAEAAFTSLSTATLTLRQTSLSGSALTLTSDCRIIIMRVPL
jgi:hypothetical protein